VSASVRIRQFWAAVSTQALSQEAILPAKRILNDAQMALFLRLQPSEQAHALRVLQTLQKKGERHPDLLTAALLHDAGKSQVLLRVWERVLIVLGKRLMPQKALTWGKSKPVGWKRAFVVARQHPTWGATLAAQADTTEIAIRLIQNHQEHLSQGDFDPLERHLLALLQEADNQN
jgi:hypothetical protein